MRHYTFEGAENSLKEVNVTNGPIIEDALKRYGIPRWGQGYFSINDKGHVTACSHQSPIPAVDLKQLVEDLQARGIALPILIRFSDILRHRIGEIHAAFQNAIREFNYKSDYCWVYPIKVNQQRHVVEEILSFGKPFGFGLEAGSKPELLAALAMTADSEDTPVICNGFKDDEFLKTTILARKMGRNIIPIVEKFSELEALVRYAAEWKVRPVIGVRVKLASSGSGRWKDSAGSRSKFGLTMGEVLEALKYLHGHGMEDCLQLVHFHLGSQITNIHNVKNAVNEAARVYAELVRIGAGLRYIDVGGGLGIDYDGSQSDFESSVNYTLQEYANDIVYRIGSVCDEAGIAHPTIISESGRAVVSYHSVLIFEVFGVHAFDRHGLPPEIATDAPQPLKDLFALRRSLTEANLLESYHDAVEALEDTISLFRLGHLSIEQRALAESLYWSTLHQIFQMTHNMDSVPQELAGLPAMLSDIYFCNLSVFQSLPDSWAIDQLFPILPIHRLDEPVTRNAVLGDVTCDSDGKIDKFIDLQDVRHSLELHPYDGKPYYLGAFLVGAYQEVLGDLHNLFGDTNAVHIRLGEDGTPELEHVVKGDTVREVLAYVQYHADDLLAAMRKDVERAVRTGRISLEESRQALDYYESGIEGYTYLEELSDELKR